jgi:hypothetical protein
MIIYGNSLCDSIKQLEIKAKFSTVNKHCKKKSNKILLAVSGVLFGALQHLLGRHSTT